MAGRACVPRPHISLGRTLSALHHWHPNFFLSSALAFDSSATVAAAAAAASIAPPEVEPLGFAQIRTCSSWNRNTTVVYIYLYFTLRPPFVLIVYRTPLASSFKASENCWQQCIGKQTGNACFLTEILVRASETEAWRFGNVALSLKIVEN